MSFPSQEFFINRFKRLPQRYLNALLLTAILTVFVVFNKAAFQTYFSDDDFSNLTLAVFFPWWATLKEIFTLTLLPNFRPFGILFYKVLSPTAGFHFWPYIAALQFIHLATALMLWSFLRRLGLGPLAAALGCAFFTLHMATLTAYWKPMYVFDVLCGFWLIASLLLFQRSRFFLSLLCAWLAFKSKEMELMLPLVLFLYVWIFGQDRVSGKRRWMPLVPFFLVSISFGLQSLMLPPGPENGYSMHLNAAALWSGITYYGSKLFYAPLSGLILSAGLLFLRTRLVTFGVLGFWLLLIPILAFPGRQAGAYLYVPLLAFSIAVAGVAQIRPWWAMLFLVFWIPASYEQLKIERSPILAYRHEHLPYVQQVRESLASHPAPEAVVFEGTPPDFAIWGQEGLFTYSLGKHGLPVYSTSQPEGLRLLQRPGTVLYVWDAAAHRLHATPFPGEGHETSYVDFGKDNPLWQLNEGWKMLRNDCRFTKPRAVITLRQPAGDSEFRMQVQVPEQAEALHQILRVSSAGQTLAEYHLDNKGAQTFNSTVSSPVESVREWEIQVSPPLVLYGEPLGTSVCACGFIPAAR